MNESIPTPGEAHDAVQRFVNSHFGRSTRDHARISIPARPGYDDDLILLTFIDEYKRLTTENEKLKRFSDMLLRLEDRYLENDCPKIAAVIRHCYDVFTTHKENIMVKQKTHNLDQTIWVAVGSDGQIVSSSNGEIWRRRCSVNDLKVAQLEFDSDRFIATLSDESRIYSTDGVVWWRLAAFELYLKELEEQAEVPDECV